MGKWYVIALGLVCRGLWRGGGVVLSLQPLAWWVYKGDKGGYDEVERNRGDEERGEVV